jgi:hypothetical protein
MNKIIAKVALSGLKVIHSVKYIFGVPVYKCSVHGRYKIWCKGCVEEKYYERMMVESVTEYY